MRDQNYRSALASLDRLEVALVERSKPAAESKPGPVTHEQAAREQGDELLARLNAQTSRGGAVSLDSRWLR